MALTGDDCYFYYYSQCSGGEACRFRHSPAALGSETMCTLWAQGACSRPGCRFRHMEIRKNRNLIPCYWESQPGGCTKPHCVFKHNRKADPLAASTSTEAAPDTQLPVMEEEVANPSPPYIPTPEVDPVVFNPFEDESDQESISTSGSPGKSLSQTDFKSGPQMNVKSRLGLSSVTSRLGEIKSVPAVADPDDNVMSSIRYGSPVQSRLGRKIGLRKEEEKPDHVAPGDRRIILSHDAFSEDTREVKSPPKVSIKRRLGLFTGNKNEDSEIEDNEEPKPKVSVKNRLGLGLTTAVASKPEVQDSEKSTDLQIKSLEEIKRERTLRSIQEHISPSEKLVENASEDCPRRSPEAQIKVKTLEEIKREKALKAMNKAKGAGESRPKIKSLEEIQQEKLSKRSLITSQKSDSAGESGPKIKSLKEIQQEKLSQRSLLTSPKSDTDVSGIKVKTLAEIRREKGKVRKVEVADSTENEVVKIKVKTLEEIRREKAKTLSAASSSEDDSSSDVPAATVSSSTKEATKRVRPVKSTVEDIQVKQSKYRKIGQAWRTAAQEAEERITSLDSAGQSSSQSLERPPKRAPRPERQIYRPPMQSRTAEPTSRAKIETQKEVKTSPVSPPKKSKDWGVKTFSEILREKQLKRRRPQEVIENEADSSDLKDDQQTPESSRVAVDVEHSEDDSAVDSSDHISSVSSPKSQESQPAMKETSEADSSSVIKKSRLSDEGTSNSHATPSSVSDRRRSSVKKSTTPVTERKLSDSFFNDDDLDDLIGDITVTGATDNKDTEDLLLEMDELLS